MVESGGGLGTASILPDRGGVSLPAGRVVFWQNMPVSPISAYRIALTACERAALVALIRPTGQARMLLRGPDRAGRR